MESSNVTNIKGRGNLTFRFSQYNGPNHHNCCQVPNSQRLAKIFSYCEKNLGGLDCVAKETAFPRDVKNRWVSIL